MVTQYSQLSNSQASNSWQNVNFAYKLQPSNMVEKAPEDLMNVDKIQDV